MATNLITARGRYTAVLVIHQITYALGFGGAMVVCLAGIPRAGRLESGDATLGLRVLLSVSALWAGLQLVKILVSTDALVIAFFLVAQTVGFASVGAWVYFCSAYAGHDFHRRPIYWIAGIALYGVVSAVKLTETIHGGYFDGGVTSEPFHHYGVDPGVLFWSVVVVTYALVGVGLFTLLGQFRSSDRSTTVVSTVAVAAVLPAVPTVVAFARPELLVPLDYEPLGVAAFVVGMLYVAEPTFREVHEAALRTTTDDR